MTPRDDEAIRKRVEASFPLEVKRLREWAAGHGLEVVDDRPHFSVKVTSVEVRAKSLEEFLAAVQGKPTRVTLYRYYTTSLGPQRTVSVVAPPRVFIWEP